MEPKEVTFERTFDAPIERVWQAWTDPEELMRWWGPDNVQIPECEVDLRVGGRFYIVMEATAAMGPYAGTRWPMDGTYTAIETARRLAYASKAWTEGAEDATLIDQEAELTLTEEGNKTKMALVVTVKSVGPNAGAAIEGMQYGFNQQFDKLTTHLAR